MKPFAIIVYLLYTNSAISQTYFSKLLPNPFPYVDGIYGIAESPDSSLISTLTTFNYLKDTNLIHLVKVDKIGNFIWNKEYGRKRGAYDAIGITNSSDGNYIICGEEYDQDSAKVFLLKVNSEGDSIWMKRFSNFSHYCYGSKVRSCSDGGFIISGASENFDSIFSIFSQQIYLIKTDSLGILQWQTTFGDNVNNEVASDVVETADEGFIAAGRIVSPYFDGDLSMFWIKVDKNGVFKWSKKHGVLQMNEACTSIIPTYDGNFMIGGGFSNKPNLFPNDPWGRGGLLVKIKPDGSIIWVKNTRDDIGPLFFQAIIELPDHSIAAGGYVSNDFGSDEAGMAKFTEDGEAKWKRIYDYNPDKGERFYSLIETKDKGFALVGYAHPIQPINQNSASDGWILKVDSLGCEVANCVLATEEPEKDENEALKIYPNPISDWLKIELPALAEPQDYHFQIMNLFSQTLKKGGFLFKTTEIDVYELPAGIYLVAVFKHNQLVVVKKVIIAH